MFDSISTRNLVVTSRFSVSPSILGRILSYILSIVQVIQITLRQLTKVKKAMVSTERLSQSAEHDDVKPKIPSLPRDESKMTDLPLRIRSLEACLQTVRRKVSQRLLTTITQGVRRRT